MEKRANFDIGRITTYQAGVAQASMHRLLQKLSDRILLPFGITKMQWLIIGTIHDAGAQGARISDVAETLDTTIAYLTNSINLLELRKILIRRDSLIDSRSRIVTVTAEFVPKIAMIEEAMRVSLRKSIYSEISREDFITYMKVVFQLIEVGKKQDKLFLASILK